MLCNMCHAVGSDRTIRKSTLKMEFRLLAGRLLQACFGPVRVDFPMCVECREDEPGLARTSPNVSSSSAGLDRADTGPY